MTIRAVVWGENVHEQTSEVVRAIYPDGMHCDDRLGAARGQGDRGDDRHAAGARARADRKAARVDRRAALVGPRRAWRGQGRGRRARRAARLGRHGADRAPLRALFEDLQAADGHALLAEMARGGRARARLGDQPRPPDRARGRRMHRDRRDRDVWRALRRAGADGDGVRVLVRGRRGVPLRHDLAARRRQDLLFLAGPRDLSDLSQ